jgi:methyltransferase (TIGR00027 family)
MPLVSGVSDTAHWVATYRAWESARSDALFRDPFAHRLAGSVGPAMAAKVRPPGRSGWATIVRTKLIDDLVLARIARGCGLVVDLGAGFDTRPYRLPLPSSLRWVEADLPSIIDEKEQLLKHEKPHCEVRRERVNLTDSVERAAFLNRVAKDGRVALVITEGLLMYLDDKTVGGLASDLLGQAAIRWWVLDLFSPSVRWFMQISMRGLLANAPLKFAPKDGVAFFERLGWKAMEVRSIYYEAARLNRLPEYLLPFTLVPEPDPRKPGSWFWSAVARLDPTLD